MTLDPIEAGMREPDVRLWETEKRRRMLKRYSPSTLVEWEETIAYEVYHASLGGGDYVLMSHEMFGEVCDELNRLRALEADRG